MTKTEMRETAKRMLMHQLSMVFYQFEDPLFDELPEEIHDQISKYIHQYGDAMGKAIGKDFYTT